jgi:anti-sigma factor RsiW
MMPPGPGRPVACGDPIGAAVLVDYWLGVLPPAAEQAVEEHLLSCDACGDGLREVIALSGSLRALARSGALQVVVTDRLLTQATESGLRVREYAAAQGDAIQCTVTADDDLLVARLAADLTGASRVDLSWCDPRGVELVRMADIPVRADAGSVICQQSITWSKASPSVSMTARLLAVDVRGEERLLGEYTFHHTRTIPGPPGWERP